ncbi:hypothetical protein DICSQDRAFT_172266 [Dichomitus squalens LYAD-421 SS1]|uniref:Uncharacterized protein n=1 Tax=Dichomitus squalens (strain LYAD-421) TaxID=732165 RepID=R7STQ7_DICSQ|nr:uncharacterized protein DICSQDRAFT_172266 [Dichomitus squalens LYAD-421 SS1]EJF59283.1 hypothetical protein DICSQDRAFT_172266 [Dichomitus squalens LYAD-421 SS1]
MLAPMSSASSSSSSEQPPPTAPTVSNKSDVPPAKGSVVWKKWPSALRALIAVLPAYQALLRSGDYAGKRAWMSKTIPEMMERDFPESMIQQFGTDKLRVAVGAWLNNNRNAAAQDVSKALNGNDCPQKAEDGATASPSRNTGSNDTARAVVGKIVDNPLAKALRARKVSPMRLWGSENNARVQERIEAMGRNKIGGWSRCASYIWHNELEEAERSEWVKKAEELSMPDDEQCYINQLSVTKLLVSLLTDLISIGPSKIGKACFAVRLAYRAPDGQLIYEDFSLTEDEKAIMFAHFDGGASPEEDEQWMKWVSTVVGVNPKAREREVDYDKEGAVRLRKWTGSEDVLWMKRALRAYFKEVWAESGNEPEAFTMEDVIRSPTSFVDGDWVDMFKSDPFQLEPADLKVDDTEGQVPLPSMPSSELPGPSELDNVVDTPGQELHDGPGSQTGMRAHNDTSLPHNYETSVAGSASVPEADAPEQNTPSIQEAQHAEPGSNAPRNLDPRHAPGAQFPPSIVPPATVTPHRTLSVPPEPAPTHPAYARAGSTPATLEHASHGEPHVSYTPRSWRTWEVLRSPARSKVGGRDSPNVQVKPASVLPPLFPIREEDAGYRSQEELPASVTSTPCTLRSVVDRETFMPASSDFETFPDERSGEVSQPDLDVHMGEVSQPVLNVGVGEPPLQEHPPAESAQVEVGKGGEEMTDERGGDGAQAPGQKKRGRPKANVAPSTRVLRGRSQGNPDTDATATVDVGSVPLPKKRKSVADGALSGGSGATQAMETHGTEIGGTETQGTGNHEAMGGTSRRGGKRSGRGRKPKKA